MGKGASATDAPFPRMSSGGTSGTAQGMDPARLGDVRGKLARLGAARSNGVLRWLDGVAQDQGYDTDDLAQPLFLSTNPGGVARQSGKGVSRSRQGARGKPPTSKAAGGASCEPASSTQTPPRSPKIPAPALRPTGTTKSPARREKVERERTYELQHVSTLDDLAWVDYNACIGKTACSEWWPARKVSVAELLFRGRADKLAGRALCERLPPPFPPPALATMTAARFPPPRPRRWAAVREPVRSRLCDPRAPAHALRCAGFSWTRPPRRMR